MSSIRRKLWPYPSDSLSFSEKKWRSVGKRLVELESMFKGDDSKRPSSAMLEARKDELKALAVGYFAKAERTEILDHIKSSISTGASQTDYLFLHSYITSKHPKRILELGPGATTCIMAQAFSEFLNANSIPANNKPLNSVEHMDIYFEDLLKLIPDGLKPFVDAQLIDAEEFEWKEGLVTSSYERLPEGDFDLVFVDGPPANQLSNGDMFRLIERAKKPLDIVIDRRTKTSMTLERFLPPDTVFFDFGMDLGFARQVTPDMLLNEPRVSRPLKHKDIFGHFEIDVR